MPAIEVEEKNGFHSEGARAVALSNLRALHIASARKYKSVLIMEDDIVFRQDFNRYWDQLVPQIEKAPWEIIYGYDWTNKNQFSPPESIKLQRNHFTPCCHFWAIHSRIYEYAIYCLESNDKCQESLVLDDIFSYDSTVARYAPNYNLVGQRVNESDTKSRWQGIDVNQYSGVYWHG